LCLTPPTEGFPWDDLCKILPGYQRLAKVPIWRRKVAKNFNRLHRVHERYRRQTDGRAMTCSERDVVSSRSLKRSNIVLTLTFCYIVTVSVYKFK